MRLTAFHNLPWIASLLCALALLPAAYASPIIATFTVMNTDADGFVTIPSVLFPGDLSSFDLTGGNTGSGLQGQTQFTGTAPASGIAHFQWSYTSCYPPNEQPPSPACDAPGFDWAGYLVNQSLTILTDTDTGGVTVSASFPVSAGAVFGWYVGTSDNLGEPGTLTVSNVSFTTNAAVPEPGTLSLCLTCIAAVAAGRKNLVRTLFGSRRKI